MKKSTIMVIASILACALVYLTFPSNVSVSVNVEKNSSSQSAQQSKPVSSQTGSQTQSQTSVDTEKNSADSKNSDSKGSDSKDSDKTEKSGSKSDGKSDSKKKTTEKSDGNLPSSTKEIITKYTEVMNQLKKDRPTATKKEYQALPEQYRHFPSAVNTLLSFADSYMVKEDDPDAIITITPDMENYTQYIAPINIDAGCLLLDYDPELKSVENAKCEDLGDGTYKISFSLAPEENPEPTPVDTCQPVSAHGAVFAPASRAEIMVELDKIQSKTPAKVNDFKLSYADCTSELIFNPENNHVVSLTQHLNVDIFADLKILVQITGSARLTNDMFLYDIQY